MIPITIIVHGANYTARVNYYSIMRVVLDPKNTCVL